MAMNLNNIFGVHENALAVQSRRSELLAENLANSDTPGFKARDIDFKKALSAASAGEVSSLQSTSQKHIQPDEQYMGYAVEFRVPQQPSIDGNTVESHIEMAEFTNNAMRYMASLRFINGKVSTLMSAIRGE